MSELITINEQLIDRFRAITSDDKNRGLEWIDNNTLETILSHATPLLGKTIDSEEEDLNKWPINDRQHVIAMQLASGFLDKALSIPMESGFDYLMGYLEFISPESKVMRDEVGYIKLLIRPGTSSNPPIYAYTTGFWGWEVVMGGYAKVGDKHTVTILAQHDPLTLQTHISPELFSSEYGNFVMKMQAAGQEGKKTLPEYLRIIDGHRTYSGVKPALPPKSSSLPQPESASKSGCMITLLLLVGISITTLAGTSIIAMAWR